ncbi:MAG: ATP-binding cassette domain-containing protein [Ruminococcaceae bacterium]|nr:ATP-binding cassette domain-containing protein [Oscillospiraceae bacterium]
MIKINNLYKNYGPKAAVKGISFSVQKGEIVGFLGPNGAGKSTTMNILTGYLSATDGTAEIAGYDVLDRAMEARKHVGYLPEQPPLYLDMTVNEYLNFVYDLKKAKGSRTKQLREICEKVGIADVRKRLIKNLSKGYKQRVGIASALVGDPEVLILDEPTVGLDPNQISEIRNLIRELGREKTIILSTHIIPEVMAVCERVVIINDGQIVADDKLSNLMDNASGNKLSVELDCPETEGKKLLSSVPGVMEVNCIGKEFIVTIEKNADVRRGIFFAATGKQIPILSMHKAEISLEKIFADLTMKGGRA